MSCSAAYGATDHAYITDFGVARNVATESGLTQTGRFVGTLDYVAPEQISGSEIDARAESMPSAACSSSCSPARCRTPRTARQHGCMPTSTTHLRRRRCYVPRCRWHSTTSSSGDVEGPERSLPVGGRPRSGGGGGAERSQPRAARANRGDRRGRDKDRGRRRSRSVAVPADCRQSRRRGGERGGQRSGRRAARSERCRRRRGFDFAGGLAAIAAIVVARSRRWRRRTEEDRFGRRQARPGSPQEQSQSQTPHRAQPIDQSELIAKADAVCADSQRRYLEFAISERSTSRTSLTRKLVRFGPQASPGAKGLTPPSASPAPTRNT